MPDLITGVAGRQRLRRRHHPALTGSHQVQQLEPIHPPTLSTPTPPPQPLWTTLWTTEHTPPLIKEFASGSRSIPDANFLINGECGVGLVLVASGEVARSGLKIVSVAR
ncbi:hypothetical protein GCM10029963_45050 [Micromonospora andamanensis]